MCGAAPVALGFEPVSCVSYVSLRRIGVIVRALCSSAQRPARYIFIDSGRFAVDVTIGLPLSTGIAPTAPDNAFVVTGSTTTNNSAAIVDAPDGTTWPPPATALMVYDIAHPTVSVAVAWFDAGTLTARDATCRSTLASVVAPLPDDCSAISAENTILIAALAAVVGIILVAVLVGTLCANHAERGKHAADAFLMANSEQKQSTTTTTTTERKQQHETTTAAQSIENKHERKQSAAASSSSPLPPPPPAASNVGGGGDRKRAAGVGVVRA